MARACGVGLASAAVMLFELLLLRIFSFTIWHHFAFLVLSIALFGFAVSGVLISQRPRWLPAAERGAAWSAAIFAMSAPLATALVVALAFDPTRVAVHPAHLLRLVVDYVILAVPFTAGGLVIGLLLAAAPQAAARIYAADLVGAALGALLVVPLLPWVSAEGGLSVVAALALVGSALLFHAASMARRPIGLALLLAVTALLIAPKLADWLPIPPGPSKGLARMLRDREQYPRLKRLDRAWNALSRVDLVVGAPDVEWTRNRYVNTPTQLWPMLVLDGDAATPIANAAAPPAALEYLSHTLSSTAPQVFHPRRVLVIGAGGGVDILTALHHGAELVDAVELNPDVVELTARRYPELSGGLFQRPGVNLIHAEGRSFVARTRAAYDLIQISLIDTWAASAAGAHSLAEGYLYTIEAFEQDFARLSHDGVLSITRWATTPPRELIKLCNVAITALQRRGVARAEEKVFVLRMSNLGLVLVKPAGFTAADRHALASVAATNGFVPVYGPDDAGQGPATRLLEAAGGGGIAAAAAFDTTPPTDDRPYFFQFGRWRDLLSWRLAWGEDLLYLSGRLVVAVAVLQAVIWAALLLAWSRRRARRAGRPLAAAGRLQGFFLALGIGFMFVEIVLMQRLTLYLGNPLLATSVVLAALLVGAGCGSLRSTQWIGNTVTSRRLFLGIGVALLATAVIVPVLTRWTIAAPDAVRIALAVACTFALGLLLGLPLACALSRVAVPGDERVVACAWAANGAGSVLGPVLASAIALDAGLTAVLLLGAACYLVAGWLIAPLWNQVTPSGV